jgi:hypothetical protein
VPLEDDCLPLRHSPATRLHWLPRDLLRSEHGQAMRHAVQELASLPAARSTASGTLEESDIDTQLCGSWPAARAMASMPGSLVNQGQ